MPVSSLASAIRRWFSEPLAAIQRVGSGSYVWEWWLVHGCGVIKGVRPLCELAGLGRRAVFDGRASSQRGLTPLITQCPVSQSTKLPARDVFVPVSSFASAMRRSFSEPLAAIQRAGSGSHLREWWLTHGSVVMSVSR